MQRRYAGSGCDPAFLSALGAPREVSAAARFPRFLPPYPWVRIQRIGRSASYTIRLSSATGFAGPYFLLCL